MWSARRGYGLRRGCAAHAVKQGKLGFLFRQKGQKLAERGKDGEPRIPAIAVPSTEQRGLLYHVRWWLSRHQLTLHRLGDDETEVMGEPVCEPLVPMPRRIGVTEHRFYPNLACADLDRTGWHIVGPQIEGAAICQCKTCMVPMAGQDAVFD